MKRYIFNITAVSALSLSVLTACDLDQMPNGQLPIEESWQQVSDAQQYQNGMYDALRSATYPPNIYSTDVQADQFNAANSYGNWMGYHHRWDFSDTQTTGDSPIWSRNYTTIKECNNIINNIDNIKAENDSLNGILKEVKGEAYLVRAMSYHNIVLRYAKDYEASSATTDLGLPLATTVDISAKPTRSSLKDTYDFIKKDIEQAKSLMTNNSASDKYHLSLDDATLFEARVDLYMDDYANADALAQKLITSGKYPLISEPAAFNDMWTNDEGSEIMFEPQQTSNERMDDGSYYGIGAYYLNYTPTKKAFDPLYIPSKWVVDSYEDKDIRKDAFFISEPVKSPDDSHSATVYLLKKYPGNPALKSTPDEYTYYNMIKIFRIAEAYLISAEARYRKGDEAGARQVLNLLRSARKASLITSSGDQLFSDIKAEWGREFIGEGNRLECLKRWHDGFNRHDPQSTNITMNANPAAYTQLSIKADDKRFIWEIPTNDRRANPDIKPNW